MYNFNMYLQIEFKRRNQHILHENILLDIGSFYEVAYNQFILCLYIRCSIGIFSKMRCILPFRDLIITDNFLLQVL